MKNRFIAGFLAVCMTFCMVFIHLPHVMADENTITLETKEDFIEFASSCTLDSWSKGKTVNLTADIDFSESEFVPVPTFCGTFNGNGYTVSGIYCDDKGSYKGVFRYIEQGGSVSDLNVNAKFILNGSKSFLGGIAGENSGTIENCSFDGSLKGENVIGGIVGNNTEYGRIIMCSSNGNISGENSTGGIVGKNSGFVQGCTNSSSVNTVYEEKKKDISDIETDAASIIENYKSEEEENGEESVLGHTDTGGIAGFTSGIIQGCTNNGTIGYKHIGYNVGGIAGRQSGYILGCQNLGLIQGRKDVGGIVGQAEPYILLHASNNTLQELKSELNSLNAMVNKFISDSDTLGDETKNHLDSISKFAKAAQSNAQSLINQGTDFADDNLAEINAQAAILSNTLTELVPVFDELESGGDALADAVEQIKKAIDDFDLYDPNLGDEIDDIARALSYIAKSEAGLKKAASLAQRALYALEDAISLNKTEETRRALEDFSAAINDIISAKQEVCDEVDKIKAIVNSKPESFEALGINAKEAIESLKAISSSTAGAISSLKNIKACIDTLASNTQINFSEIKSAAENMQASVDYLSDALLYVTRGLNRLGDAIGNLSDKLDDYIDDANDELSEAKENISQALDTLSYAAEDIADAVGDMKNIISDLANEEPLKFVKLGDDFKAAGDNLFNSLTDISDEIDGLKNTVSNEADKISGDLTAINNKFNVVMNLLIGEVEGLKNGADSLSDIFVDVSDEDISSARQGKLEACKNYGSVEADRNTGGIVGNIAIEYSKDPEDDIERPDTLNFTYRVKAILQSCINDGKVIGKKDCVGGIAGKAEIGAIYECENYGDTESTGGNYVGGIIGRSDAYIRKSYAKNKVSGKKFIGGIAGKADTVSSSYTITSISGDESLGSICGEADKNNLNNNFYIDNGLGALDGISYSGRCEKISFDELKNISGIPERFISFTVTFVADGKTVEIQEIKYGDETKRIKFPDIPEKDGCFGEWESIAAEAVTENITVACNYQPYITMLSSTEKNENGKLSLALAEGEFTNKAELHVTESLETAPVKTGKSIKVFDISLENTDIQPFDTVNLRLLNENKYKVSAWQLRDGKWESVKTAKKGKYVALQLKGTQSTVCLKYDKRGVGGIVFTSIAGAAALCTLVFLILKRRKKQNFKSL